MINFTLRQLRYFVRVVELGSMGRAAIDLDLVQSALSQQISRLESELSTRLLQRTPRGVVPTEAGAAFFREAQLTLRHAAQAVRAAQQARLSGSVSVGLAPTTAAMLGLPLMQAMQVQPTWMAAQAKAFVRSDSAHWRRGGLSGNAFVSHPQAVLGEVFVPRVRLEFAAPQFSITPGQAAVFYAGEVV